MTDTTWFKTVFIKWLRKAKSPKASYTSFITSIFRLDRRIIETIVCLQDVQLSGAVWVDSVPVPGLINKRILKMKQGQVAFYREDLDEPFITLENKHGTININKRDWNEKYRTSFSSGFRDSPTPGPS